ncbi:MAG: hypothetical protein PHW66_09415 [Gallionella sp.]|nr:hypothetical protein [Gallionella sp.]
MSESIEQWNAKVVPRNTRRQLSSGDRKPQDPKAFKRAKALYMQGLELKTKWAHNLTMLQMLINGLPEYKSRGHGRTPRRMCRTNFNYKGGNHAGRYPSQGKSECARRVFQAMSKQDRDFARRIGVDLFGEISAMVTPETDLGGAP